MPHPTLRASTRLVRCAMLCLAALIGLLTLPLAAVPPVHAAATTYYVRASATGTNTGASWSDAFTSLQDALTSALSGDQIWVAAGTYTPSTTGDRTASFTLKNGVAVYGGFTGTETALGQRNWTSNGTTLSGAIGSSSRSDNSYHVVSGTTGATLDGFTISDGYSSSSLDYGTGIYNSSASPTLSNLIISENSVDAGKGGGMYNNNSSPTLTNVTFRYNQAYQGGAIYNIGASNPTLLNVVITRNYASYGSGIYVAGGAPTLTNVTIADNWAYSTGGGIYSSSGSTSISNSIIWDNTASSGSSITGSALVSYSIVQDGWTGTGNLSSAPLFSADYHLQATSPAIDAGNNNVSNPSLPATDRDGNERKTDVDGVSDTGNGTAPIVDMGAYEMPVIALSSSTRLNPVISLTNATSVQFQVVFAANVSGVDTSDFAATVVSGSLSGASITNVSGSGTTYTITVATGSGDGVLRLEPAPAAQVVNAVGSLTGVNAFTSGESYTIDTTTPAAPLFTGITTASGTQAGGITADPTISLNGSAEANSTLTLSRADLGVIGTTSANGAGAWSFDHTGTTLPVGSHSFTATATDATGNTSPSSNAFVVTVRAPNSILYVHSGATGGLNNGMSWADAYTSLESALTAAVSGNTIWVAADIYVPTTGSDRTASFSLKNGVAVYGGFAGSETELSQRAWATNVTTLSGDIGISGDSSDNSYHVVTGADGAILDGFSITGGNASGSYPNQSGGGILNLNGSPTLANLIISGNSASGMGGGNGGGIYTSSGSPTLTNVTISDNSASSNGGGMYTISGNPTLTSVTISGNSASGNGGGILNSSGSPTLTNITISGNSTGSKGGGMYNSFGSPMLTNVTISGNSATDGGGVYVLSSNLTITNATISGNTATNGAGLYNQGLSVTLTNVTVSGNQASSSGGAIYNHSGTPQIRNSIIWGNRVGVSVSAITKNSGTTNVTYSLVEGGYSGSGNLNLDPLFVSAVDAASAPTTAGDLRLQASSPAFQAGNNDVSNPGLLSTDLDGKPRIVNGSVDMGAYERQTNLPPALEAPPDLSILEDVGAQTVNLSGITTGGGSQTLSINAVSSNPAIIPNPAVSYTSPSASGSLSFTPAANAFGTATITVMVQDSGGTADGGVDTLTRSFTVTVTPLNDAPDFTPGSNQTLTASTGAQTVAGWASGFSAGPADEASQTLLGYTIVSTTNSELFSVVPAIDASGTLTYTPMPGASGTATISVVVRDSGGTTNGGADTSAIHTFTITVDGSYQVYLPFMLGV